MPKFSQIYLLCRIYVEHVEKSMWNIGHFGCTAEPSCYAFIAKVTSLWISNQKIKKIMPTQAEVVEEEEVAGEKV